MKLLRKKITLLVLAAFSSTLILLSCFSSICGQKDSAQKTEDWRFGVYRYFQIENGVSAIEKDLNSMKSARIMWRRVNLNWDKYKQNKGYLDRVALEAHKRGINLLVMLVMGKYSVLPDQGVKRPGLRRSLNDYRKFISEASERYDGDGIRDAPGSPIVKYWQIGNEQTGPAHFWKRKRFSSEPGPASEYVKVLKTAYVAIKNNQPGAKVVLGGLGGYDRNNYLEKILRVGGGSYFDILDFHIYGDFQTFYTVMKVNRRVEKFREILRKYGLGDKPIWSTEMTMGFGYFKRMARDKRALTLGEQLVKRYIIMLSTGVSKAFWEYFDCRKKPGRGLLDRNLNPKPVYLTYRVMTGKLWGFTHVKDISTSEYEAYKFIVRGREVIVLWTDSAKNIDLGSGFVTVTGIAGDGKKVEASQIVANHLPIFIEKM